MIRTARLGDFVRIRTGKLDANASVPNGEYPFFTCAIEPLRIDRFSYDCECILIAGNGDLNVKYFNGKFEAYQRTYIVESIDKSRLFPRFLFHFMCKYIEKLRRMSIGGVIKYIKLDYLTEVEIPHLDFDEQRRIADVLDRAETLRAKRRAALAELDGLAQSIFLEMFGDPVTNPKQWPRVEFADVLAEIESGWSPVCLDRTAADHEWGVLKLGAVTQGEYRPFENKALPPDIRPDPSLEVQVGDLLFSRKNTYDLVAACALVRSTPPRLMLPDLIFRLRLKPNCKVKPEYIHQLISNSNKRSDIQRLASGTSGSMPNISKGRLMNYFIEVPPLPLQQEFAERLGAVEKLKAVQRASLAELDALFASLQDRAFRGAL